MTSNGKDTRSINTGGGAHIAGNVTTGGGDFVGRDKVTTAGDRGVAVGGDMTGSTVITGDGNTVSPSPEGFLELLAQMRELVRQSGLDERKARIIEGDMQTVEEEVKSSKPDSSLIVNRLEGMTRILKATDSLTQVGGQLLAKAEQALTWAGSLF